MAADAVFRAVRRFQVLTQDEAETEEFIRRMYIGNRTWFHGASDGARFSATVAATGEIAVSDVRSTVDYSARCDPFDHFLFIAVSNGRLHVKNGRDETIVPAGETTFYPLGVALDVDAIDVGVRTLQLPLARLEAAAEEAAGIAGADLRFEAITPVSAVLGRRWSVLVNLAGDMLLADDSPAAHPLLAQELTRTAAITALHTFPNTALTVSYRPGPGWVAPAAVRRAAAYIHAHADQPVTLDQIAAAAGISVRALQHAFRRHYDATPMGYLRRTRLEFAHRELQSADPASDLTVAEVARRWGWASPGQFTVAYQRRFGILPSRTLRT